jgi:hypothetical protein
LTEKFVHDSNSFCWCSTSVPSITIDDKTGKKKTVRTCKRKRNGRVLQLQRNTNFIQSSGEEPVAVY